MVLAENEGKTAESVDVRQTGTGITDRYVWHGVHLCLYQSANVLMGCPSAACEWNTKCKAITKTS